MKIQIKVKKIKVSIIIIVGYSNSINAQFKGGQWLYKSIVYKKSVCKVAQWSSMYANSECFAANRPKTKTVIYSDVQHMIESNHFPYYRHYVFLGPGSTIQEGGMNKYARFAKAEVWLKEQQSICPWRESITQPLDYYHSITTTYTTVAFM